MAPFLNAEVVPMSEVPDPGASDQESNLQENTENPVVLVVDDEPLVADTLAAILNHAGYNAMTAYGGPGALEMASVTEPDLLISDFAMPNMNGVELALAVLKESPDCRILLFSGHATVHDLAPARKAGYTFTLLTKPLHPSQMLEQISRTLRRTTRSVQSSQLSAACMPDFLAESA